MPGVIQPGFSPAPSTGQGEATSQDPAFLQGADLVRHANYDTVRLTFSGHAPDYHVALASPPREAGSGKPAHLRGNQALQVDLTHVETSHSFIVPPDYQNSVVAEVDDLNGFEGQQRVGIGADTDGPAQQPFRVHKQHHPHYTTINIDIAHG